MKALHMFLNKYIFYSPTDAFLNPDNQKFLEPFIAPLKNRNNWDTLDADGKINAINQLIKAYCKVADIKKEPDFIVRKLGGLRGSAKLPQAPFKKPRISMDEQFIYGKSVGGRVVFPPSDVALYVLIHELEHVNQWDKKRRPLHALLSPVVESWGKFVRNPGRAKNFSGELNLSDDILLKRRVNNLTERGADDGAEVFLEAFKVQMSYGLRNSFKKIHEIRGNYFETAIEVKRAIRLATFNNVYNKGKSVRNKISNLGRASQVGNAVATELQYADKDFR
jgi:hypothetical protein